MGKPSYETGVQKWVKELFEALLDFVDGRLKDCNYLDIQVERPEATQLILETRLDTLRQLAEKRGIKTSKEKVLSAANVRDALKDYFQDFLKILKYETRGHHTKGDLILTLSLWSEDTRRNLALFDEVWKEKKAEKDKQKKNRKTQKQKSKSLIDWQQICQNSLYYQRKQSIDSLTDRNGYLADRLDFVPLGLLDQQNERSGNTDYEVVRTFYKHKDFFEPILGNGQKRPNSQGRRLAIIGDSGVGKTTFLLKTGFWLLEQTNELPIWIDLGKLGKKTLDEYLKEDWLREATGKRDIPSEWITDLEQHLENGDVCLLLDGVEKLSGTYIHPLKQIISQITAWVGKTRIILTCRTSIWNTSKDALFSFDFDTYQNLGFQPDQVKDFVTSFFANEAEQFWAELDQPKNQRIKDLARNPLYLRFLCSTWQPQCQLSSTKAELIRQFLDKDYDRNIQEVPDNPQKRPLFKALGKLALQAIKEGRSQLPRSIVSSKLGESDEKLFQLVVNRLGWLQRVNPYQELYSFLHDSIKEYLAACAIPKEENWQYFLNHIPHNPEQGTYKIFKPQWKEVILFWLGREDVEKEQKEAFIDALIGFEDSQENFYRFRADFLAAVGIAEFTSCRRADEIVEWLVAIGFGSKTFQQPSAQVARTILLETNRSLAIIKLDALITNRAEQCIGYLVAWGLGQVGMGSSQAITTLISLICTSTEDATHYECNSTHYYAIESLGKIATEHTEAISVLLNLIHTRTDLSSQVRAAKSLGQISSCHESEAINTLLDLMHPPQGGSIRCRAAHSLVQIAPEYIEQATNTLIEIIDDHSTNDFTRHVAAHNLKKITPKHPKVSEFNQLLDPTSSYPESPAELLQLICNSADSSTRVGAAMKLEQVGNGKDETINTLLYLICNSSDSLTRLLVTQILNKILRNKQQFKLVVSTIKDYLWTNDFEIFDSRCYEVLWHCAQNLPYLDFYQAWHDENSTLSASTQTLEAQNPDFSLLKSTEHTHPLAINWLSLNGETECCQNSRETSHSQE